jgi:EpsI family protein
VAFVAAYEQTIWKLVDYWSTNDMYSYGFLVPFISGYLIWLRRERLWVLPVSPSFGRGMAALSVGLAMLVVGRVSATNVVEELSLPVSVWGVSLLVLGSRLTQRLTFPLAYLFTMIPFWDVFTGPLHEPFQLYSAAIGVGALRILDIPVFHHGTFIELPKLTLEVAQVCSGVNSLVAILCIGVPLTHYYVSGWPKRLAIIASAALIALLSNGVRVAGVCLFAYYDIRGADGDVHGPFSLLRSLFISATGFLALFWLVSHFADRERSRSSGALEPSTVAAVPWARWAAVVAAIAMLMAAGTFAGWWPNRPVPLSAGLVGFPTTIGRWEATDDTVFAAGRRASDFDAEMVRGYASPDGREVNLLLGYFASQVQGRELAGVWIIQNAGFSELEQAQSHSVGSGSWKELIARKGMDRFLISYAYILDGQVVADDVEAKLRMTWNVMAQRRSNGGIVIVAGRLGSGEDVEAARAGLRAFVEAALPPSAALLSRTR